MGLVVRSNRLVAVVLGFAPVAYGDVQCQSQRPDCRQRQDQFAAHGEWLGVNGEDDGRAQEKQGPQTVDETDVLLCKAKQPAGKSSGEDYQQGNSVGVLHHWLRSAIQLRRGPGMPSSCSDNHIRIGMMIAQPIASMVNAAN